MKLYYRQVLKAISIVLVSYSLYYLLGIHSKIHGNLISLFHAFQGRVYWVIALFTFAIFLAVTGIHTDIKQHQTK